MSIIKKVPYIESVLKAYSETTLTNLLSQLNTPSVSVLSCDWNNLPESLVATCLFNGKLGILVRESAKVSIFLAYDTAEQDLTIYEIDFTHEVEKEIKERLTISELRRVLYEIKDTASAGTPFSVVEITGLSGTLSDDDYATLSGENAVIKAGTQYYYKNFDASTLLIYQAFSRVAGQDSALYDYIEITKSTKGFELKTDYMVEGNPSGNATEPLTKLKVGETIYSIPDGVIFKYIGTTTTVLADGDTTNPITIDNESVTAVAGDVVFYNDDEFVFDGTTWNQFGSVGFANPMTTAGDLIVGGASGTPTRLPKGTSGQVLKSTANGLEWGNESGGGMTNPMTTSQDIIVGGNSGEPTRLAKGDNGYLLGVNASGNLAYTNSLPIITTAPTQANTNGLIIVVLSSEPATKYNGYLYLITE